MSESEETIVGKTHKKRQLVHGAVGKVGMQVGKMLIDVYSTIRAVRL